MVRGGGYGSGAGGNTAPRYNSSSTTGRRTAGVRSWARARLYSKNVPSTTAQRYNAYYYNNGRVAGNAGATVNSGARRGRNFAIIRGRYSTPYFASIPAGHYRYFRASRGGGYVRGGAVMGNGRSATAGSERTSFYSGTRGGAGTAAAGSRGPAGMGRGRGSRGGGVYRGGGGGVNRGGGVRGFARGAFRRRERGSGFRGRGRGRGAGFGRGGRGGGASAGLNKEALDAELDKYMGDDNIKKRLDSDLEKYFSRSGGGAAAAGAGGAGNAAAGGGEQGAGVVGGAGPGAAVSSVVDSAVGAGPAAAGGAGGAGDATTNGTIKPTGGMDVSMDNSL